MPNLNSFIPNNHNLFFTNGNIEFINGVNKIYNIKSDDNLIVRLKRSLDVNKITIVVNDNIIEYNVANADSDITLSIPNNIFIESKRYIIKLFPYSFSDFVEFYKNLYKNDDVDDSNYWNTLKPSTLSVVPDDIYNERYLRTNFNPNLQFKNRKLPNPTESNSYIELILDVIDEDILPEAGIIEVSYPTRIKGPDYVGYNVDFDINWKSENIDYIRLYIGESEDYVQCSANFTQTLNVGDILNNYRSYLTELDGVLNIPIKLISYNESGKSIIIGNYVDINIIFELGKQIPRETAIKRIISGFISSLDTGLYNEHNYLNHLLHLGGGNNQLIANWVGLSLDGSEESDSLILKLYEPLQTNIQLNQKVWVSKLQTEPIIDTIILSSKTEDMCNVLQGPNFNIEPSNGVGYQAYDELIASGSLTSDSILREYINKSGIDTTGLNIRYVKEYESGSLREPEFLFENFIHFGSAEERIKNFWYKLELIEQYNRDIERWNNVSFADSELRISNIQKNINNLIGSFDGFETYLYNSSDDIAYPKSGSVILDTSDENSADWYNTSITKANYYDRNNPHYINNNLPSFIQNDHENEDFMLFMDMIGQHFDIIWSYINALSDIKNINTPKTTGVFDGMVYHMLKSLGWEGTKAFNSNYLWEYAFGLYKDGTEKYKTSGKNASNEVWRRILNNLPYLLKHKGTARSIKALLACYGIPSSLLTIMEYGGPQNDELGDIKTFTFEDRTAAIRLKGEQTITLPWKSSSDYPQSIELMIRPSEIKTCTLLKTDGFTLDLVKHSESYVKLRFTMGSDYDSSIFKISTENFSNIIINRNSSGDYTIWLKESDGYRITKKIEVLATPSDSWISGSTLTIGDGFVGDIDEFRLWYTPLSEEVFNNHTLFPDAINGNTKDAYQTDLLFRLDFEYPKDRVSDNQIKNVAISEQYNVEYATANNFYTETLYPYQYTPYDRTVTAQVPSIGFTFSNKIRFENIELVSDLSHKIRATKKEFDRAPIDSSKLGLFLSANKELNMDIIKSFGPVNIGNLIGNPSDEYKEYYSELITLRNSYFKNLNRNIYEYINLVKYIDRSLFDNLKNLIPIRAKLVTGLLIEPHILERSKIKREKPSSDRIDKYAELDLNVVELTHQMDNYDSSIDIDNFEIDYQMDNYSAEFDADDIGIESEYITYNSDISIDYSQELLDITSEYPFQLVGNDFIGIGVYVNGINGGCLVGSLDKVGNVNISRKNTYLVKEEYKEKINIQTNGWPATTENELVEYEARLITKDRNKILVLPWSDSTPIHSGNIVEIYPLSGYHHTHYKYVNNLNTGLRRSFYIGSLQTNETTPDGLSPVEVFMTNPNVVRVAETGRTSGAPLLGVG
jgi:hypothetical protein